MEGTNEHFNGASSSTSENQIIRGGLSPQFQSRSKRKSKLKDNDLARGLEKVASQLFKKLLKRFEESAANYPKYLAVELNRLGFSSIDNLKISKAMRSDPSNVEVFKIIKTDAKKIEFATGFLDN